MGRDNKDRHYCDKILAVIICCIVFFGIVIFLVVYNYIQWNEKNSESLVIMIIIVGIFGLACLPFLYYFLSWLCSAGCLKIQVYRRSSINESVPYKTMPYNTEYTEYTDDTKYKAMPYTEIV